MEKMKKSYMLSRMILVIITFILFHVMFINEDRSWKALPLIFSFIVFCVSYPSSIISRKMIGFKTKRARKILYYSFILPLILFLLLSVILGVIYFLFEVFSTQSGFDTTLGQGLMFLFFVIVITICIVLPYIQTILVLIINRFIKD